MVIEGDIGNAGALPKRFRQRSSHRIAHAREWKEKHRAGKREERLQIRAEAAESQLGMVWALVPSVGKILGKSISTPITRKRRTTPKDFLLLVRGLHLPNRSRPELGVKTYLLSCLGSDMVLCRQFRGLHSALKNCARALDACRLSQPRAMAAVHVNYSHMWDEAEQKYRWSAPRSDGRRACGSSHTQTMVQRGSVVFALSKVGGLRVSFTEPWLCKPVEVSSTSAEALYPAVKDAMPKEFVVDDLSAMRELLQNVSHFTFQVVADRASGNLLLMKKWGESIFNSISPALENKVLFWPDKCSLHLHHRAKKQLKVKDCAPHISRHFSISSLFGLAATQTSLALRLELIVQRRVRRKVGKRPEGLKGNLRVLVDVLYDWNAPCHRTATGAYTKEYQDLQFLCDMVNGDVTSETWYHYCHDETTGYPCCVDEEQAASKTMVACRNAMFGTKDARPAENTWAHIVPNFRRALLRVLVHRAGIHCFSPGVQQDFFERDARGDLDDVDRQALESFFPGGDSCAKTKSGGVLRRLFELPPIGRLDCLAKRG